ncbi:GtrA family protein [Marinicauda algicola]|uniref:GtrA family protein n=1 Tax=Marinicauda algicola TaxID=2029849 RepID=UPI0013053AF4
MISNLLLYLLYLLMTRFSVAPELSSAAAFLLGASGTYIANRGWSFESKLSHTVAAPRYFLVYCVGLGVQIVMLSATYRGLGIPHEISQLAAMITAAGTIFTLLNFWVFGPAK